MISKNCQYYKEMISLEESFLQQTTSFERSLYYLQLMGLRG